MCPNHLKAESPPHLHWLGEWASERGKGACKQREGWQESCELQIQLRQKNSILLICILFQHLQGRVPSLTRSYERLKIPAATS